MSRHRISPEAGFVDPDKLPRGPNGRAMCRQCKTTEVPKGCRTFCSDTCVTAWKIKTQPGFVRHLVKQRDHGICRACGFPGEGWERAIEILHTLRHGNLPQPWRDRHPDYWNRPSQYGAEVAEIRRGADHALDRIEKCLSATGFDTVGLRWGNHRSFWQADHIVPVDEGGGETGIENYQTLCTPCHKRKTREQAARRRKQPDLPLKGLEP